jgi:hypothetical protein
MVAFTAHEGTLLGSPGAPSFLVVWIDAAAMGYTRGASESDVDVLAE